MLRLKRYKRGVWFSLLNDFKYIKSGNLLLLHHPMKTSNQDLP